MPPRPSHSENSREGSSGGWARGLQRGISLTAGQCPHFDEAFPRLLRLSRALHHRDSEGRARPPNIHRKSQAACKGAASEKENFEMKKLCLSLVLGIVAFGFSAARAQAQDAAAAHTKPHVETTGDIRLRHKATGVARSRPVATEIRFSSRSHSGRKIYLAVGRGRSFHRGSISAHHRGKLQHP